jgi:hypothetical protein
MGKFTFGLISSVWTMNGGMNHELGSHLQEMHQMRKRETHHEAQLNNIPSLPTSELQRRFALDHHHADHIASEVLATLVLNRVGQASGVTHAAAEALIKRIQSLVGKRWQGMKGRPEVLRRGNQAFEDVLDYVWDKLLEEKGVDFHATVTHHFHLDLTHPGS